MGSGQKSNSGPLLFQIITKRDAARFPSDYWP
jgi:hypothetical protein